MIPAMSLGQLIKKENPPSKKRTENMSVYRINPADFEDERLNIALARIDRLESRLRQLEGKLAESAVKVKEAGKRKRVSESFVDQLDAVVSERFELDVYRRTNMAPYVRARSIVWFLANKHRWSYAAIGRRYGYHHTTVMYGIESVGRRRREDQALDGDLKAIEEIVSHGTPEA